jgi:hypothetical protein
MCVHVLCSVPNCIACVNELGNNTFIRELCRSEGLKLQFIISIYQFYILNDRPFLFIEQLRS